MRVYYRSVRGARRCVATVYEAVRVVFCCAEMKRQWGRFVSFGVIGHRRSTDRNVNICAARPQTGGATVQEVVAIGRCPWCGRTIETARTRPIRKPVQMGETPFSH